MNFAIQLLLNSILGFLASTIKNPKSVVKYKTIFVTIRDGFNALILALGGEGNASFGVSRSNDNTELFRRLAGARFDV